MFLLLPGFPLALAPSPAPCLSTLKSSLAQDFLGRDSLVGGGVDRLVENDPCAWFG